MQQSRSGGESLRSLLICGVHFLVQFDTLLFRYVSNRCASLAFSNLLKLPHVSGWGAHTSNYPQPYLTAAATVGIRKSDVDLFVQRLDKAINKLKGKSTPATPTSVEELASMSGRRSAARSTINGDSSTNDQASSASNSLASSKDSLRK